MCGIAGFFSKSYNQHDLQRMTNRLSRRGPDAEGMWCDETKHVGLGHRRLSILDLSPAGNQPFYSRDGRYVMVYNGEVYNFREIAARYQIEPRTGTDTEVILECFARIGEAVFEELNGMFAFAIWDSREEKLYLVRDRVGIKPLYYLSNGEGLAFGSELKAFEGMIHSKEMDPIAISDFLHLGYISGERTIYKNIRKLKPGHVLTMDKKGIHSRAWWSLQSEAASEGRKTEGEWLAELETLVQSSVGYCLISDVPLGIFLSGGVDSSLVAAVAQQQTTTPINTFSIGFEEKKFNETAFASQVAKHIGSHHHEFIVKESDAVELVPELLSIYDEPYGDSSAIPTLLVSKLARQQVTVALSGDGGDELFMGYGFYYWARRLQQTRNRLLRRPMAALLAQSRNSRLQRAGKMFEYPRAFRKSHIFSQEQYYFTRSELNKLLVQPAAPGIDEQLPPIGRKLSWAEEQSFFDILNYLPEELLVKTDRASMYHSLEVRVPLLDHRLVEFAVNLPEEWKLRGNTGKYLLKQLLYKYVPATIFDRPKWGFAVPLSKWLRGELSFLIIEELSEEKVRKAGVVHYEYVARLLEDYKNGTDYLYTRVWALIVLHKWINKQS